ncbi:putative nuclease HARBI1 [Impatiens glandulifera]|uniref:putative nuclease HARBI1 n=1 Tax=Impatiens glandulifera TaxID=253017 RepID=UPI001FB13683|nr:putative nuclease HARBI1 [Impatiens glandulifera]
MNFNVGDSSSSDDENTMMIINDHRKKQEMLYRAMTNNNMIIQQLLEQQNHQILNGGSVPGHIVINRDREAADRRLYNDYFSDNPLYNDTMFRRRYRMSRSLFLRIVDTVKDHDGYFQQRSDNIGRLGLSPIQKITSVFRMLAYGVPADATDEYIKIGESTAIESMKRFCRAVVEIFGERYLRRPTTNDISRLLYVGKKRGFPGMLGSLDCMHWKWKNCPTAWAGQYAGRSGKPTIILEAIADYDLWIWHAYFVLPGTNNDINVLESSHLFSNLTQGISPPAHYVIQGKEYNMGYYLADSIYPKWSTIVQTIHEPRGPKKKHFAMKQEACRKDVERAFGVLQSRFSIVAGPVRYWRKEVLHDIMTTCIILHNMIIEDERDLNAPIEIEMETLSSEVEMVRNENTRFQDFISRYENIRNKEAHIELCNALIDHLWEEYTNSENL